MATSRLVLEYVDGSRPAIDVAQPDVIVGRAASCPVRLDGEGVSDKHARLARDASGTLWVQDLDSYSGTLKNGEFVYGRQPLADGDLLQVGSFTLRINLSGVARASSAPASASAPAGKPQQEAFAQTLSIGTPSAGVVVGAPDPEPSDHRTVQMEAPDIEALMRAYPQTAAAVPASTTEMAAPLPAAPAHPPKANDPGAFAATMPPPSNLPPSQKNVVTAAPQRPGKATMMGYAPATTPPKPGAPAPAPTPARTTAPRAAVAPPGAAPVAPAPVRAAVTPAPVRPAPAAMPARPAAPAVSPEKAQARTVMAEAPTAEQLRAAAVLSQKPVVAPTPSGAQSMSTMQLDAPQIPAPVAAQPQQPQAQPYPQPTGPTTAPSMPVVAAIPAPSMGTQPIMQAPSMPGQPQPASQQQIPQAASGQPGQPFGGKQYVAPARGSFGAFSRALSFMGQMFGMAMENKALLKPLMYDLIITTPISIGIGVAMGFINSRGGFYALLAVGTLMLYFVDYACNALTASLIYDYATTGEANMANAMPRVKKSLSGILVFAAVSALLDVASTYARERRDVVSRIILNILRAVWTTATYVIMPALVLEGVSFGDAFKRSKVLMDQDPTGVGAGVVAMSITSYIAAAVIFPMAWFSLSLFGRIHPALGGIMFFLLINLYWSVSGWMKIAYSTCFYMWARECERTGSQDHALAPLPLRTAIEAG